MGAYQTIVVGTDGSESSLKAVDRAGADARDVGDGSGDLGGDLWGCGGQVGAAAQGPAQHGRPGQYRGVQRLAQGRAGERTLRRPRPVQR